MSPIYSINSYAPSSVIRLMLIFERAFTYLGGMFDEIADGISVLSTPQRVESKVSWGK